jgi:uncharacterized small protein (TIGR04563 family)
LTPDNTPTYTHPLFHAPALLHQPRSHTGGFVTTMGGSDKRKQSLYFPEEMLKEIQDEATRQDRSLSWIVQKAWKISRKEIMKYPSVNEFPGEEDERGATE